MLLCLLLLQLAAAEYIAVQFSTPITNALRSKLEKTLLYEVRDYLGDNSLLLWFDDAAALARLRRELVAVAAATIKSTVPWNSAVRYKEVVARAAQTYNDSISLLMQTESLAATHLSGKHFIRQHTGELARGQTFQLRVRGRNLTDKCIGDAVAAATGGARRVRQTDRNRWLVTVADQASVAGAAAAILSLGQAKVVELRAPFATLNRWSVPSVWRAAGGDRRTASPLLNLTGSGQILSLSDTGVASDTCFFFDRTAAVPRTATQAVPADTGHAKFRAYWQTNGGDADDKAPYGGHGTHVAGSAVGKVSPGGGGGGGGASAELGVFAGVAPDARLAFVDMHSAASGDESLAVPDPLDSTLLQWSFDCGARVHSASWGALINGRYSSDEAAVDRFAYNNREFLPIFAAGNSGPRTGTIVSPAMAKNALTVGATMNGIDAIRQVQLVTRPADDYSHDWLAEFSSRGSRTLAFRKPDLVAPGGAYVWSAANTGLAQSCAGFAGSLIGMQGTSMATPHVAGAALLVRQYFQTAGAVDTRRPMASLIRATLVASAVPLQGVFPRTPFASTQARIDAQGHGRVALDRALGAPLLVLSNENSSTVVSRTIKTRRWCIEVRAGAASQYESLTVAMAYADYPSFPGSASALNLVNDLRLRVRDGDTRTELAINDLPVGTAETRSTTERAVARGGSSRRLIVEVSAESIGFGDDQSYSLVLALVTQSQQRASEVLVVHATANQTQCAVCANGFVPQTMCQTTTTTTTLKTTLKTSTTGSSPPTTTPRPKATTTPRPKATSTPQPTPKIITTVPTAKPTSRQTNTAQTRASSSSASTLLKRLASAAVLVAITTFV